MGNQTVFHFKIFNVMEKFNVVAIDNIKFLINIFPTYIFQYLFYLVTVRTSP